MKRMIIIAGALAALAAVTAAEAARATFPGSPGKIAFVSVRAANQEIYVMNADGSGQTRLTFSPGSDRTPSWSPDGTKIAFTSFRDGRYQLYVMNADGTDQHRVTNDLDWDAFPSWTADGRQLVFQKATFDASGNVNSIEIWAVNADGSGSQRNLIGIEQSAASQFFAQVLRKPRRARPGAKILDNGPNIRQPGDQCAGKSFALPD